MTIIEKILSWFKKKEADPTKNESKSVKPKSDTKKVAVSPIGKIPTKTPYKIKYTTTMINTITLSSDMKTLYLIDNGRAIDFPIDEKHGILIGTINGQITVATALSQTEEQGGNDTGDTRMVPAVPEIIKLPAKEAQWTMVYRKETALIGIIGTADIDFSFRNDDNCESHVFNLNEKVIKIKKITEGLEVSVLNR